MKSRTKKSQSVLSLVLFVGSSTLGACQALADEHTSPPALASVRGTLSLAPNSQAPTGAVNLAILWDNMTSQPSADTKDPSKPCAVDPEKLTKNPDHVGGFDAPEDVGYLQFAWVSAAQQVSLTTAFPVEFTLNIADPPPPEALRTLEPYYGSGQYGRGELVVYRDANANGRLDLSTFQQSSPDELLGTSTQGSGLEYTIEYADRKPVFDLQVARRDGLLEPRESASPWDQMYAELEAGYNVIATDPLADLSSLTPATQTRLSDGASVALELNPIPALQMRLCAQACAKPDDYICPADPRDLPPIPDQAADSQSASESNWLYFEDTRTMRGHVSCVELPSGERYLDYWSSVCEGCACAVRECAYWSDKLPDGASLPCDAYQASDGVPPDHAFSH